MNPLNSLFDLDQEGRRTGALSELGVQYAGSNGTVPDRNQWGGYNGANRGRSSERLWTLPLLGAVLAWAIQ